MTKNDLNTPGFIRRSVVFILVAALLSHAAFGAAAQQKRDVKRILKEAGKLFKKGDLTEAEKLFKQVLEADPEHVRARLDLSMIYIKQRRIGEAFELVYPVVEKDKENANANAVLGTTLLAAGRFREARLILVNALKIDRGTALAWSSLGMLEFYENRIDESLLNLKEAVYRDQGEPDYLFYLGQVSARAERYNDAADSYRKFLMLSRSTDDERRDRIKGIINFLEYLGQRRSLFNVGGRDSTTVPIRLRGNRPFIEVKVNGKDEIQHFVLDTGSGISVISEETAERLGISKITRGGFAKGIGGDGRFEIVYGFVEEMQIGDVKIRNIPVYVRKFHHEDIRIDGYIGLSLVSKFLTAIDYGGQTFSLARPKAKESILPAANAVTIPLRLTSSGFLSGEVHMEGVERPLNFILDTGASISVISERLSRNDAVSEMGTGGTMRVIGSAGVMNGAEEFIIPGISFGPHVEKDIRAIALDLDLINESSGFEQAGILGGNFLNKYRITFDFQNSAVVFERSDAASDEAGIDQ